MSSMSSSGGHGGHGANLCGASGGVSGMCLCYVSSDTPTPSSPLPTPPLREVNPLQIGTDSVGGSCPPSHPRSNINYF